MTALLLILLAAPGDGTSERGVGSISVIVNGPRPGAQHAEVIAVRDGIIKARVATRTGSGALLSGLRFGAYDIYATAAGHASRVVRGVRAVSRNQRLTFGVDVGLTLEPVFDVAVHTSQGATAWSGGRDFHPAHLRLFAGLNRVVLDHPRRVSSASRLVRVTKAMELKLQLEPGLVLLGRVADAEGVPLAGARVSVFADGLAARRWTLTRADGSFGVSGFYGDVVSVEVAALGYATNLRRVDFTPGSERARIEIAMTAGCSVALAANVRVQAVLMPAWYEGTLEEPRLRANHKPVRRTGKRVLFSGLTPGRRYRVLLSASGYLPFSTAEFTAPTAGQLEQLPTATLRRGASIRGVLHGFLRPHGGGHIVLCRGPEGLATCRTDRAGSFEFTGLDAGKHFVSLLNWDERGREVVLTAGQEVNYAGFTMPQHGPDDRALGGIVMDADGKPLPGVVVEAAGKTRVSDDKGEFSIPGLPFGRELYTVRLAPGPSCRALAEDPHLPHTEKRVRVGAKLRVPLKRSGTLRLRFDTPLARATLLVSSNDRTIRRRIPRGVRTIDVEELALGAYKVDVAAPGLLGSGGVVLPVRRKAGEPVLLNLARGRRAAGRVVLRRTVPREKKAPLVSDTPVRKGWVSLLDASALRAMAVVPLEEDGRFTLDGLPLGTVVLCAGAPGLPTSAFEFDLAAADRTDLVLAMQDGVVAVVFVTGENGTPMQKATVRILDMLRPDFGVDVRDVASLGRFRRVVADDEDFIAVSRAFELVRGRSGRVEAPFLHPGSYKFLVSAKGYQSVRVGVRARTAWQEEQIRRNVKDVVGFKGDLVTRIRLNRMEQAKTKD